MKLRPILYKGFGNVVFPILFCLNTISGLAVACDAEELAKLRGVDRIIKGINAQKKALDDEGHSLPDQKERMLRTHLSDRLGTLGEALPEGVHDLVIAHPELLPMSGFLADFGTFSFKEHFGLPGEFDLKAFQRFVRKRRDFSSGEYGNNEFQLPELESWISSSAKNNKWDFARMLRSFVRKKGELFDPHFFAGRTYAPDERKRLKRVEIRFYNEKGKRLNNLKANLAFRVTPETDTDELYIAAEQHLNDALYTHFPEIASDPEGPSIQIQPTTQATVKKEGEIRLLLRDLPPTVPAGRLFRDLRQVDLAIDSELRR